MKKVVYSLLALLFCLQSIQAQSLELGVFAGASTYNGDLTQQYLVRNTIHPAFGGFAELHLNDRFSTNLLFRKGTISADDSYSKVAAFMERNLSFRSDIIEFQLTGRYYPYGFDNVNQKWAPYLFTGITIFHFNPEAYYDNKWVELQPLSTEGQGTTAFPDRDPYKLTQVAIPMGAGLKYIVNYNVAIAIEGNLQVTFTDYLDDVSKTYVDPNVLISEVGMLAYQLSNRTGEYLGGEPKPLGNTSKRGNPDVNDYYGYFGVTFSYILPSGIITSSETKRANIGCRP